MADRRHNPVYQAQQNAFLPTNRLPLVSFLQLGTLQLLWPKRELEILPLGLSVCNLIPYLHPRQFDPLVSRPSKVACLKSHFFKSLKGFFLS